MGALIGFCLSISLAFLCLYLKTLFHYFIFIFVFWVSLCLSPPLPDCGSGSFFSLSPLPISEPFCPSPSCVSLRL